MSKVGGGGGSDRSGGAGGSSGADRSRDTSGPDRSRDTSGPDKSKDVSSADKSKDVGKSDASDKAKEAGKAAAEKTKTDSFEKGGPPQAPDTKAKQKDTAPAPKVDVDLQAELKAEIAAKSTQTVIESPKAKEKPAEAIATQDTVRAAEVKAQNEALAAEAVMAQEAVVASEAKAAAEAAAAEAVATQDAVVAAEAKAAAEALAAEAVMAQEAAYQVEVDATIAEFESFRDGFDTAPVDTSTAFADKLETVTNADLRAEVVGSFESELAGVLTDVQKGDITGPEAVEAVTAISRSAELAGNAAAQSLAATAAKDITAAAAAAANPMDFTSIGTNAPLNPDLNNAIEKSITNGSGALLSSHLTQETAKLGFGRMADQIDISATRGVREVRTNFEQAKASVSTLEKDWETISKDLIENGGFTTAEIQEQRKAFEARHAADFAAFEKASEIMGTTLTGLGHAVDANLDPNAPLGAQGFPAGTAMMNEAYNVAAAAPDLQMTQAGMDALAKQVAQRGTQEPNLLGTITDTYSKTKGGIEKAAMLISNATAHGALRAQAAGNTKLTESLLNGFRMSSDAFGLPPEKMDAITDALRQVSAAETPEAARAAARALQSQIGTGGLDLNIGGDRISGAIGAIGGALTLGDAISNGKLTNPESLAGALKNYVDATGATIDTTVGIANLVGKNIDFLTKANTFGAKVLGPIGGVLDGALAINHAANGEMTKAGLSALSAAGAIAMAVPGGQLVGAGLLAASALGGIAHDAYSAHQSHKRLENEYAQMLQGMGFGQGAADVLGNVYNKSADFNRVYQQFGGNPQALQTMLGMTPDQLNSVIFGGPRSRHSLH
jgi:hypothetical protein